MTHRIVLDSLGLQLAIHHLPALQALFDTTLLLRCQCLAWLGLGSILLIVLELLKVLLRQEDYT